MSEVTGNGAEAGMGQNEPFISFVAFKLCGRDDSSISRVGMRGQDLNPGQFCFRAQAFNSQRKKIILFLMLPLSFC